MILRIVCGGVILLLVASAVFIWFKVFKKDKAEKFCRHIVIPLITPILVAALSIELSFLSEDNRENQKRIEEAHYDNQKQPESAHSDNQKKIDLL
jgi:hypothetical protein